MNITRFFLRSPLATAVAAFAFGVTGALAADDSGAVQGVVTNAAGQPVTGAFVKLKNAERRLTFMVISQANGAFNAANLPAGVYTLQGVGEGFESVISAPVNVASGNGVRQTLSLARARGPLLPPAWPQRIPEAQQAAVSKDYPAGPNHDLVVEKCGTCHNSDRVVVKRTDRDDWGHIVTRMRTRMVAANMADIANDDANKISDYLAANFSPLQPRDPNNRLPTTLMQGKALKYRAVTYDLANKYAEPHDVAMDPQGNAWVAERAGKLGRWDPRTLEFVEKTVPPGSAPPDRQSLGNPQIDSKGVLWVADGPNGRWLSFDTKTDASIAFAWPKALGNAGGNSMAVHPDGTIWATGANKEIRVLDPQKIAFKSYESPSAKGKHLPGAYGVAVAGDGSVWWAQDEADSMVRIDPATGKMDEYKIPYQGRAFPRRMNSDANGDLWVALWLAGKLMKIDHKTREMTIYTPPSQTGGNYSVIVDKQNNFIWVSEHQVDKIARFDPKTLEWVEFPLPESESDPRRIDIDPLNPNRVFFSGNSPGRMGFVEVLP